MNKLIQREGPLLALITTEGFEDVIYIGNGSQWADGLTVQEQRDVSRAEKPEPLIPREMVLGVRERVDSRGQVVRPLDEAHFVEGLRALVDRGAPGFVVSLLWSYSNPVHEQRVRALIEEEYPDAYLGSMPVTLSSEVVPKRFEYPRTMTTILNAYLHQSLSAEITEIADRLRDAGYRNPLMLVHNSGGMADAYRTTAIATYNGGPVAGLIGSALLGRLYGAKTVIFTDMGGTSFDVGLVVEDSTRFYQLRPTIDRWLVDLTVLETKSIGAGGGSIAWLNERFANQLEIGPRSAGSNPGPVAYDQGGAEPTVTDADVVLGYIDPEYFHGGQMKLNRERAYRAIRSRIARPLGIDVEQAALLIKRIVNGNMGDVLYKETVLRGYDPRQAILFASGGAGPAHCAWYGFHARVPRLVVFPFSPVFCAFGSSTMDIVHLHERSRHLTLLEPGGVTRTTDYERFNEVVHGLEERARLDLLAEGLDAGRARFSLELDMRYGGQLNIKRVAAPVLVLTSEADVDAVCSAFADEYSAAFSRLGVYPEAGVEVENFALRTTVPVAKPVIPELPEAGEDSSEAVRGARPVYWEAAGDYVETKILEQARLVPGNVVHGPAVIEAPSTTIVIPPNRTYRHDRYGFGVIE
jgi:N-methylhydantoinase A/acetophenone carboxylase